MKYLIFPVLFGLGLAGCSQANPEETVATTQETHQARQALDPVPASKPSLPEPTSSMIYTGELNLAVDDFDQASARLNDLLLQHHAYLSTAHETRSNGQHRQEISLNVKPSNFLELVTALGKLGRIESKDISSADVTADVLATAAEVNEQATAQAKTDQQLAKAATPADRTRLAAAAQQQRAALAAAQARLQQLSSRSTWATLTLRYYQTLPSTEITAPELAFVPRFLEAFNRGWSFVLGVVVVLTNVWPLLVLAGIGTWGARRWRLRHPVEA
jgi:hypothetical protein